MGLVPGELNEDGGIRNGKSLARSRADIPTWIDIIG